jgi:hypothetical protein
MKIEEKYRRLTKLCYNTYKHGSATTKNAIFSSFLIQNQRTGGQNRRATWRDWYQGTSGRGEKLGKW